MIILKAVTVGAFYAVGAIIGRILFLLIALVLWIFLGESDE